jgi:hypothetical protein
MEARFPGALPHGSNVSALATTPRNGDVLDDRLPAAVGRLCDLDRVEHLRRVASLLLNRHVVPRVRLRQIIERLNVVLQLKHPVARLIERRTALPDQAWEVLAIVER